MRYDNINTLLLDYLAGFFDAEGYVGIYPRSKENRRVNIQYVLSCKVTSCDPRPLKILVENFGGCITLTKGKKEHYKPVYMWSIGAKKALVFLEQICSRLVIKKSQAEIAIVHQKRKIVGTQLISNERTVLEEAEYILLQNLKKQSVVCAPLVENMPISYLAGFFDGEGCISIYSMKYSVREGSKKGCVLQCSVGNCDPRPLQKFVELFGGSVVLKKAIKNYRPFYNWKVSTQKALAFLLQIKEHLIIKQDEAEIGILHQNRKRVGVRKTVETMLLEQNDAEKCKSIKHREFSLK